MGGFCCCSKRAEPDQAPVPVYYPQGLEEHEHLPSTPHGISAAVPTGVLVDINLDISTPDTLQAPPGHSTNMGLACSQILSGNVESPDTKSDLVHPADSQTRTEADGTNSDMHGALGQQEGKDDGRYDSPQMTEDELQKPVPSATDEEDVCPICLEEYDLENPSITTKCKHHFHLSCILEWMERSDTCPICDQTMTIDIYRV